MLCTLFRWKLILRGMFSQSIINAIIFLVPISAFDKPLAENSSVNQLEDSKLLLRSIVSNKLLESVDIILLLNKY